MAIDAVYLRLFSGSSSGVMTVSDYEAGKASLSCQLAPKPSYCQPNPIQNNLHGKCYKTPAIRADARSSWICIFTPTRLINP